MTFVIDPDNFAICAIATVAIQLSFFLVAFSLQFDKCTDFAGGTNFVVLALLTLFVGNAYASRQILVTVFVTAWGLRLSGYLLMRILVIGKDDRFDGMRENFWKFLGFWTFQAFWIFIVSLSVIIINSPRNFNQSKIFKAADIVGFVAFAIGLLLETVADFQKFAFKQDERNRGHWCDVGVWKWSRHPNYFGEILLWWGIFMIGCSVFSGWEYVAILSPIFITVLLLFVSGIPMLEKSADAKFGINPQYRIYKSRTSVLFPLPPAFYAAFPTLLKTTLFCDWPLYNNLPEETLQEAYRRHDS